MYSETCINRSRSKAETLLRRTDTFDPICFLYAFLPLISKAKTVKMTLLQTNNFFQSSNKKATCHMQTNKNFRNFRETKNQIGHFCQISQKETFFYTLKQQFFFDFILQFWRNAILLSRTLHHFFQITLCNRPTVVLRHWKRYRTGTFKSYSTPLWTIGFSIVTHIKLWWSVKDLQKNLLKILGYTSHCRHICIR